MCSRPTRKRRWRAQGGGFNAQDNRARRASRNFAARMRDLDYVPQGAIAADAMVSPPLGIPETVYRLSARTTEYRTFVIERALRPGLVRTGPTLVHDESLTNLTGRLKLIDAPWIPAWVDAFALSLDHDKVPAELDEKTIAAAMTSWRLGGRRALRVFFGQPVPEEEWIDFGREQAKVISFGTRYGSGGVVLNPPYTVHRMPKSSAAKVGCSGKGDGCPFCKVLGAPKVSP